LRIRDQAEIEKVPKGFCDNATAKIAVTASSIFLVACERKRK